MTIAVVDLGYGDAGKGSVVDRICAQGGISLVVRFNGGCQAAHNVVTADGRHHTFAQFGSGTLQGVRTLLSKHMIVEPLSLLNEGFALKKIGVPDPFDMVTVDPDCLITTPFHWLLNRWREDQRGDGRHGSTGRGVGATAEYELLAGEDALVAHDLANRTKAIFKLRKIRAWAVEQSGGRIELPSASLVYDSYEQFQEIVKCFRHPLWMHAEHGEVVFEGAQGVMLDEHYGFHPYTTWSTVTPDNARQLCRADEIDSPTVIGVTRAYSTRHGAGPFVPEDSTLNFPEAHNKKEHYQGAWRVGHLDLPALRYAIDVCDGIDSLFITHLDAVKNEPRAKVCVAYENTEILRLAPTDFAAREAQSIALMHDVPVLESMPDVPSSGIEELLGVPLKGISLGPSTKDGVLFDYQRDGVPWAM